MSFALRIINVTEKDAGIYSCVLKDKKNTEMWKTGTLLQPGGLYTKKLQCFTYSSEIAGVCQSFSSSLQIQVAGDGVNVLSTMF